MKDPSRFLVVWEQWNDFDRAYA